MRFTEAEVIDNMRLNKQKKAYNIFYTLFKSKPDLDKLKTLLDGIPDWQLCVFPRHIKYLSSLIENDFRMMRLVEEYEFDMMGLSQLFAKIESSLELEYEYRYGDKLQELENSINKIEELKELVNKNKDWMSRVSDTQMQMIILVLNGYGDDDICKSLRTTKDVLQEKLFGNNENSVIGILKKGA